MSENREITTLHENTNSTIAYPPPEPPQPQAIPRARWQGPPEEQPLWEASSERGKEGGENRGEDSLRYLGGLTVIYILP